MCFLKAQNQTLKQRQFITELKQCGFLTWNKIQRATKTKRGLGILQLLCANHTRTHISVHGSSHTSSTEAGKHPAVHISQAARRKYGSVTVCVCVCVCVCSSRQAGFFSLKTQNTD